MTQTHIYGDRYGIRSEIAPILGHARTKWSNCWWKIASARIDPLCGSAIPKAVCMSSKWLWMRTWAACSKRDICGSRHGAFYSIRCHIPDLHWPIWICRFWRSPLKWLKFEKVWIDESYRDWVFLLKIIAILVSDFPSIMDLHRRFVTLCRNGTLNVKVFSFIEMELTQLSVLYLRIIDGISGGAYPQRKYEIHASLIF